MGALTRVQNRHDEISNERQQYLARSMLVVDLLLIVAFVVMVSLSSWQLGLNSWELWVLVSLTVVTLACLLLAAGAMKGAVDIIRNLGAPVPPPVRKGDAGFLVRYRWLFYYAGLFANILALAFLVEITGGLFHESPLIPWLVAFILIGQQLSRFNVQSGLVLLVGVVLVCAMPALDGVVTEPNGSAPNAFIVAVIVLTFIGSGWLTHREKPPNPLAGEGPSPPPTHAHLYRARQVWHFVLYRDRHRVDPVLDSAEETRVKEAFQEAVQVMGEKAGWSVRLPKGAFEGSSPSFTVALEQADQH